MIEPSCPECGATLVFHADVVGETCGGLALRGWMWCEACAKHWLAPKGMATIVEGIASGDEWTLAKGGRSLNCGGVRIRAEGKTNTSSGALMARIQRLPFLEAVLADPLVDVALGYLVSSHADYDEGEKATLVEDLRARLRALREPIEADAP